MFEDEPRELTPAFWENVKRILAFNAPYLRAFDKLAKSEIPPAFLSEPMYVGDSPRWPDYETFREDYHESMRTLNAPYQVATGQNIETLAGLGIPLPVIIASAAVFAFGTGYFVAWSVGQYQLPPESRTARALAELIRESGRNFADEKVRASIVSEGISIIKTFEKQAKIKIPMPVALIKEGAKLVKWLAIGGGVLLLYKVFK